MEITRKSLPEQHYIYVDREASFSKNDIAEAMGSGFGAVFMFTKEHNVSPLSMPASIYMEMPSDDRIPFRAAFFVSADDAAKATGEVKAAVMPAGDVAAATHVGPYAGLKESHKALWDYVEAEGLAAAAPVWEIYIDDPTTVPEAELRTEIYRAVGA